MMPKKAFLPILILAALVAAGIFYTPAREQLEALVAGGEAAAEASSKSAETNAPNAESDAPEKPKLTKLPVDGVEVLRGDFVISVRATGRAEALRRAELSLPVSERVSSVRVRPGDPVRRGDTLLELARRPFEIAREEAAAIQANKQIDADVQMLGEDSATADKIQRVAHRSGLTEATAKLARAEMDLEATTLHAPFNGHVVSVDAAVGELARAQETLLTLVDLSTLRIPVEVLESDFGRISIGNAVDLSVPALSDQRFEGTVVALAPELDAERGTGIAYVELSNDSGHLKPGMYVEARIAAERLPDRLFVPRGALLERDRRLLVFRAIDGRAEWTYVKAGRETDEFVEIVDGLEAGDTVLVDGHLTLAHGTPIKVSLVEAGE